MFDEPLADAWHARYGEEPPSGLPDFGKFLRHRSIRNFSGEPVSKETVRYLIACAQSAATSSNLQLWSVVSVQDRERRDEIAKLCADQHQIREAAWYFAFLADHHRLRQAAAQVGEGAEGLVFAEFFIMALIDAALAAERMVCAAESMGLGICYIGALRNDVQAIQNLLELPEGVFGVFGLCLGWPEEPVTAQIKPRLRQSDVWFRERYSSDVITSEYDERMRGFYESQGMKSDATWRMRSGRRVDLHHMTGRERLKPWLLANRFLQE